jgi:hypothetical protein
MKNDVFYDVFTEFFIQPFYNFLFIEGNFLPPGGIFNLDEHSAVLDFSGYCDVSDSFSDDLAP